MPRKTLAHYRRRASQPTRPSRPSRPSTSVPAAAPKPPVASPAATPPKPVAAVTPPKPVAAAAAAVPKPVPLPPQVVRRALCIGINYTGSSIALNGCINDQENIVQTLTTKAPFTAANIVIMNDRCTGTAYPTKSNIWTQLNALRQWASQWPSTTKVHLFVSYSGHGTRRPDFSGSDEADYYDECIVPIDYTSSGLIKDDDLRTQFITLLPSNVTLVILADACNSGTVADLRYVYNVSTPLSVSTNSKYNETACTAISLTASLDSQTAADAWLPDPVTGIYEAQGGLSSAFCALFSRTTPILELAQAMKQWVFAKNLAQQTQLCSGRLLPDTLCLFADS